MVERANIPPIEERIKDKRNSCVLVMLRELSGATDAEVFAAVRRHGYRDNRGMYDRDWLPALKELGIELGPDKWADNMLNADSGWLNRKKPTLNRMLRFMKTGTWLVRTPHHVLVVRDGVLVDRTYRWRAALGRGVSFVTEVLNDKGRKARNGWLRVRRLNPRRRGTGAWRRYAEMKAYLEANPETTKEKLLAATSYRLEDYNWDIKRGNIVIK